MRKIQMSAGLVALFVVTVVSACDPDEDPPVDTVADAVPADDIVLVSIIEPIAGVAIPSGNVRIVLTTANLQILPAGTNEPGSGHHHLIVDSDLPSMDQPIPSITGRYIHLGKGQTEFLLENLESGDHTVIALVGDYLHIPLDPPVADTVTFSVN